MRDQPFRKHQRISSLFCLESSQQTLLSQPIFAAIFCFLAFSFAFAYDDSYHHFFVRAYGTFARVLNCPASHVPLLTGLCSESARMTLEEARSIMGHSLSVGKLTYSKAPLRTMTAAAYNDAMAELNQVPQDIKFPANLVRCTKLATAPAGAFTCIVSKWNPTAQDFGLPHLQIFDAPSLPSLNHNAVNKIGERRFCFKEIWY